MKGAQGGQAAEPEPQRAAATSGAASAAELPEPARQEPL